MRDTAAIARMREETGATRRAAIGTTANDAKGKQVNDTGKYVVVFRKQADGAWKVAADIFNSDLPPAPAN